jgi:hypothetical protein
MQSVTVRSHVGSDGVLHLDIPVSTVDKDFEVMVIYQPIQSEAKPKTPEALGWPPDFFERTAGCLADDPIVRYPQGEYEDREPIL